MASVPPDPTAPTAELRVALEAMIARAPAAGAREEGTRYHEAFSLLIQTHLAPLLEAAERGGAAPVAELQAIHDELRERVLALPYRGVIHLHHPFPLWGLFSNFLRELRVAHELALAAAAGPCVCATQVGLGHVPPRTDRLELAYEVDEAYEQFTVHVCGHCGQRWVHEDASNEQYSAWTWRPFGEADDRPPRS